MTFRPFKTSKRCEEAGGLDAAYCRIACGENAARATGVEWHHAGGNARNIAFFPKTPAEVEIVDKLRSDVLAERAALKALTSEQARTAKILQKNYKIYGFTEYSVYIEGKKYTNGDVYTAPDGRRFEILIDKDGLNFEFIEM